MTYTPEAVRKALPMIWWGLSNAETPRVDADMIRGTTDPRRVNAWQDIKADMERAFWNADIDYIDRQMLWYTMGMEYTHSQTASLYGIAHSTVTKRVAASVEAIADHLNR